MRIICFDGQIYHVITLFVILATLFLYNDFELSIVFGQLASPPDGPINSTVNMSTGLDTNMSQSQLNQQMTMLLQILQQNIIQLQQIVSYQQQQTLSSDTTTSPGGVTTSPPDSSTEPGSVDAASPDTTTEPGGIITPSPANATSPGPVPAPPPGLITEPGAITNMPDQIVSSVPTYCELASASVNRTASSIAVDTDKTTYTPGQVAKLYIFVTDTVGCPANKDVKVTATNLDNPEAGVLYQQSFPINGTYSRNFGLGLEQLGRHNITAMTTETQSGYTEPLKAWTIIEVKEFTHTRAAYMLYVGFASFAGLMIVIALGYTSKTTGQILRFIFISGLIFSVVGSFTFVNEEISNNSPIGLIKKPPIFGEWMINIGGNLRTNYQDGIQIPINVIVFGIIGGYLRYLYHTANFIKNNRQLLEDKPVSDAEKRVNKIRNFYQSLEDIALLFLAPLLAIAVYFLLTVFGLEGGNSIYTIAVISFTVGLVTEEVVQALIRFTTSKLKEEKPIQQPASESSNHTSL